VTTEAVQYSKEQSTDIVYKKKKRLAKSGKDILQNVKAFTAVCNGFYPLL
jgi:hypothetical protein